MSSKHLPGLSNTLACCSNNSGDAMDTVSLGPHHRLAIGPYIWCKSTRNSCRLPADWMSGKLPSLENTGKKTVN